MRTTALASHNPARAARPHPLRTRHHIVAPALQIPEAATAAVFAVVRQRGPIARDVIAQVTKLSIATVNRQVTTLLDAGAIDGFVFTVPKLRAAEQVTAAVWLCEALEAICNELEDGDDFSAKQIARNAGRAALAEARKA